MTEPGPDRPRSSASPIALALALAASPTSVRAQLPAAFEDAWRDVISEHRGTLEADGVVGGSVALVHDGRVIAVDHFGMADLERGRAVDDATIFHWASITKTFTGVALMQLVERGLIRLDDPVVEHVPELAAVHDPFGPVEAITLRHLLSHSAGFRAPTWPWGGDEPWHPFEPTEWSQLVAMMPYTRVAFDPGTEYAYSNPGIIFVARALERVTGDVYEAYVDKNLFRPLGLTRSYFDATPWHLREHRSDNYRVVAGRPVSDGPEFDTGITTSNGGLNAPIGDLARWVAFLLEVGGPAGRDGPGPDLPRS
ncbi:MAG: serine hydrolase, partial [Gemmatimonadetes bacterium]|nr:beta-lactamase family protein [Gemmatimonadota bacterium]NIQ52880.1 beta-lactamase family protein [Gemmatimonadota bacterium]NIU73008.1 serine hydrolase [Gammaproteobacteria bacterium]NIX43355.1 serine hydrolase [Gemmatimonadota bacterium]NIY07528.1 serine hydrolase [Gemmatimonadota bacterium]